MSLVGYKMVRAKKGEKEYGMILWTFKAECVLEKVHSFVSVNANAEVMAAVVLDLGNVLFRIDEEGCLKRLRALLDDEVVESGGWWDEEFPVLRRALDSGEIATEEFVSELLRYGRSGITRRDIVRAWNSMLIGPCDDLLCQLQKWSARVPIYLLSNISAIHYVEFVRQMEEAGIGIHAFEGLFAGCFYSYRLGMVKPEERIYRYVRCRVGQPFHTLLYVDDSLVNVEVARALGMVVLRMERPCAWGSIDEAIGAMLSDE